MTIGTTQPRVTALCDGVTTLFQVPVQAYLATDFEAILTPPVSSGLPPVTLTLNSNYTLAPASSDSPPKWQLATQTGGGLTSPFPAGYTLQVFVNPVQTQQTQYVQNQQFPSAALQQNLDRLTQMVQRLEDQLNRAMVAPDSDSNPLVNLPTAVARSLNGTGGGTPYFDASGNLQIGLLPTTALTQAAFNAFLLASTPYPITPAESAASLTIVNGIFLPGVIDRYGTNTAPGVTDMTVAVSAACAQSLQAGGSPVWGAGTYLTSSSVPNLHQARKAVSQAIITRGGVSFYLSPSASQTNTLFVETTGSDANDGLSDSQPMLTLAHAFSMLAFYGPVLAGTWTISNPGGGTFTLPAITIPAGLQSQNYIQFKGKPGTLPFTPQTILDGTGAAAGAFAINCNGNNTLLLQDLLVQNFANAGSCYGVVAQEFSEVYLSSNVQFNNVDNAVKEQQGRIYYGQAGKITGGVVGITCISGETHTIGYNCTTTATSGNAGQANVGPYITGCSQAGILLQENATGHVDYTGINNCAVGIDIICASRANCNFSALTSNATAGLRLRSASNWNDNGTSANFSGNGTNVLLYGGTSEFTRQGTWTAPLRQPVDATFITNTGVLGATTVKTYTGAIGADFNTSVKNFRIRIVGTMTGTAGTKNITVNLDGSAVAGFTTGAVAGDFVFECECYATGTNTQSYEASLTQNGQNPLVAQGSRSVTVSAGTITVQETINGAADTISLRTVTIWNEGGF
ncbi:MAG TPA: hypothetical protein VMU47_06795 [Caldimonas sp.]|nr:hypothetical protein [Caldimonas sp.]